MTRSHMSNPKCTSLPIAATFNPRSTRYRLVRMRWRLIRYSMRIEGCCHESGIGKPRRTSAWVRIRLYGQSADDSDALLRQGVTRMERGPHIFKNEWLRGLTTLGRPCCCLRYAHRSLACCSLLMLANIILVPEIFAFGSLSTQCPWDLPR